MKKIEINEVPENNGKRIKVITNNSTIIGKICGFNSSVPSTLKGNGICNSFYLMTDDNIKELIQADSIKQMFLILD